MSVATTGGMPAGLVTRGQALVPGLLVCGVTGLAAAFLARQYAAPVMLLALLLGMSMNFLASHERCGPGIDFFGRHLLRAGVALLGLRITLSQMMALGWDTIGAVLLMVAGTIAVGIALARLLGFRAAFGMLTGGAVAICGASAALAISAALPGHPLKARATSFTVIGVCLLSTLAMIVYPPIATALGLSPTQAGLFFGASIHDVAQVIGAGYSHSPQAGDTATVVKLLRVATLAPIIALAGLLPLGLDRPAPGDGTAARPSPLPWFVVAFAVLVLLNGSGWLAPAIVQAGQASSQALLVGAMVAIGMKTPLKELATVGWRPLALIVAETVLLAAVAAGVARTL